MKNTMKVYVDVEDYSGPMLYAFTRRALWVIDPSGDFVQRLHDGQLPNTWYPMPRANKQQARVAEQAIARHRYRKPSPGITINL